MEEEAAEGVKKPTPEANDVTNLVTFKRSHFRLFILAFITVIVIVAVTIGSLVAVRGQVLEKEDPFDDDDSGDEKALPFSSIQFFFELNDSNSDLGVQLTLVSTKLKSYSCFVYFHSFSYMQLLLRTLSQLQKGCGILDNISHQKSRR